MIPTSFTDLAQEITLAQDSTISRTLHQDEHIKVVLFGFAAGQELSEHTAAVPALLHFLEGEAEVTLGDRTIEARPNTWAHMPARLPHSIRARTPVKMLLVLLKSGTA